MLNKIQKINEQIILVNSLSGYLMLITSKSQTLLKFLHDLKMKKVIKQKCMRWFAQGKKEKNLYNYAIYIFKIK